MIERRDLSGSTDYDAVIETPVDDIHLAIATSRNRLLAVDFVDRLVAIRPSITPFGRRVVTELTAYFTDPSHRFELPTLDSGTEFQRRVWQRLKTIPAGKTLCYGDLAEKLGSAARAVGGACRANRIPIIIPCHRIVSRQGIGGYCGEPDNGHQGRMLAFKEWLLRHEQIIPA